MVQKARKTLAFWKGRAFMYNEKPPVTETPNGLEKLKAALTRADTVIIGAGAGLSTSAGFIYSGERFETYFEIGRASCRERV